FSSRRRHTRSKRDWSSDVCSSDLPEQGPGNPDCEVNVMRARYALICLAAIISGCAAADAGPSTSGDKLYQALSTQHSQFVSVIDSRSHKSERQMPLGVPSPDWKHLYSFDTTSVVDTD